MYLLDTNIVSELRKINPNRKVVAWLESINEASLYLSVVTIAEIQAGIEITKEQDIEKANEIQLWADQIAKAYNILSLDAEIFRLWAKLMHRQSNTVYEDGMIAATAIVHQLTVVTRNYRDFDRFQVPVFNPFSEKQP